MDDQIQVWKGNKHLRGSGSQEGKFPDLILMPFVHFLLADSFVLTISKPPCWSLGLQFPREEEARKSLTNSIVH